MRPCVSPPSVFFGMLTVMRLTHKTIRPAGRAVTIEFDGQRIAALEGETIAAALSAANIVTSASLPLRISGFAASCWASSRLKNCSKRTRCSIASFSWLSRSRPTATTYASASAKVASAGVSDAADATGEWRSA